MKNEEGKGTRKSRREANYKTGKPRVEKEGDEIAWKDRERGGS